MDHGYCRAMYLGVLRCVVRLEAIQDAQEVRDIITIVGHVKVSFLTVVHNGDLIHLAVLAVGVITHEEIFPLV